MKRLLLSLLLIPGFGVAKAQSLQGFEGQNGKFGFKDTGGNIVIAPKYDYYESFVDGMCVVNIGSEWSDDPGAPWPDGGKWGYINEKGEEIVPLKYEATRTFSEGLGTFIIKTKDGKYRYGFLNNRGETVIPADYAYADEFKNHYAKVFNDENLASLVNKNGELVFPFKYDAANYLLNDRFSVGIKDSKGEEYDYLYGLVDAGGKLLTEIKYSYIGDFKDGLSSVVAGRGAAGLTGYINPEGTEIIPVIYESLDSYPTKEGYRKAKLNGKWGIIDNNGKEVVPLIYENLTTYSEYEGRILVKKDSKSGIIDHKSNLLLPIQYDGLKIFSKDLTILGVKMNGKWGLMDYNGKIIVEPKFDSMTDPSLKNNDKAFARVSGDKKYFHIDRNGNKVE